MTIHEPQQEGEIFRATDFEGDLVAFGQAKFVPTNEDEEPQRFLFIGTAKAGEAGGVSVCLPYDEAVELVTRLGKALFGVPL